MLWAWNYMLDADVFEEIMFLASLCNLRSFSLKGFWLLNLWPQNLISFPSLNWLKDHIIFSALVSFSRCLKCWFCSYWFRVIKAISEFVLFFHHFSCTLLDFSLLLFCSPPFYCEVEPTGGKMFHTVLNKFIWCLNIVTFCF